MNAPRTSRRTVRRLVLGGVAAALVLLTGVIFSASLDRMSSSSASPATGNLPADAPPLRGPGVAGGAVDLADFRGEVVLVNVWASWCAPCRDELPLLVTAVEDHQADGFRVVGLNLDHRQEPARRLLTAVQGLEVLPSVHDPTGELAVDWGARGVPETFVVDRDGQVVARQIGEVTEEWLTETVLPLLST